MDTAAINKTWSQGYRQGRGSPAQGRRGGGLPGRAAGIAGQSGGPGGRGGAPQERRGPFCPGCFYLSQQLKSSIHFRHSPGDCPRKSVVVKMLQTEDQDHFEKESEEEDFENAGKDRKLVKPKKDEVLQFQISTESDQGCCEKKDGEEKFYKIAGTGINDKVHTIISTYQNENQIHSRDIISDSTIYDEQKLGLLIRKLEMRRPAWLNTGVRKSKSPCILAELGKVRVYATIDEGSEINCIDEGFAVKNALKYVPTSCKATAAGCNVMSLAGQTETDISLRIGYSKKFITLRLGRMIVVKNLGVEILVGEPGKQDNEIITIPHKKLIEFVNDEKKRIQLPYSFKSTGQPTCSTFHCKALKNETIYQNQPFNIQLPLGWRESKHVAISNINSKLYPGIKSQVLKVDGNGAITILNEDTRPLKLSKYEHFANVSECTEISVNKLKKENCVNKIYDLGRNDLSHLIPHEQEVVQEKDHTDQVIIDPDRKLSDEWRNRFKSICSNFSDIITPKPGKYNGFYGRVDNSINFSNTPPPSVRAHLPKYSHDMLTIMGKKMDQLEEWGVLRKPEDLGIVPEFVLASMLQPKPEQNDWRLVTDFTPLNIHIKKLETVAPTIKEAKEKLAKFRYHIQLDLSNYCYQGGMK